MPIPRGYKNTLGLCFEDAYGEKPATPVVFIVPINTSGVKMSQNQTDPATLTGRRDPVEPIFGNIDVNGDIVVPLDEENIGLWLRALLGAPTTTGTADPYTHIYKLGADMPSLMLENAFPDVPVYMQYNGIKISKMSFKVGGDGECTVTVTTMGAKGATSDTPISATPKTFVLKRFHMFQASIEVAGKKFVDGFEINIDLDAGLDGDTYTIGNQGFRKYIVEGIANLSGTLTAVFADKTLLDLMINGTKTSIKLKWTSGTHSLEISLPELKFPKDAPVISGPKLTKIENVTFKPFYQNGADNTSLIVTLVNGVKSYTTFTAQEPELPVVEHYDSIKK